MQLPQVWNDTALQAVFMQGLAAHVKDELAAHDPPDSLNDLYALEIWLDNRMRERDCQSLYRAALRGRSQPNIGSSLDVLEPERSKSEQMQTGVADLPSPGGGPSQQDGVCLGCGQPGH